MKKLLLSLLFLCVAIPSLAQSTDDVGGTVVEGTPSGGTSSGGSFTGGTLTSPLFLSEDPTQNAEAVTLRYLTNQLGPINTTLSTVVLKTGSVMTGTLTLSDSSPAASQAYVAAHSGSGTFNGGTVSNPIVLPTDPTAALQAATKQYVDAHAAAWLAGGTMTGSLTLSADPTSALQAATKQYVDAHVSGGSGVTFPSFTQLIAGKGDGTALPLAEKQVSITSGVASMVCDEDHKAGIYDPRCPRYAGGIYGSTPAAAAQAMSNQMACDLSMGVVTQATAKWPQGSFPVDQLLLAPGSNWEGASTATGGTTLFSTTNNHWSVHGPTSMVVTCSDGQSHTASSGGTRFAHFLLAGCATGGCSNASGDTANYVVGGPGNVGIEMSNTASVLEYVYAKSFGGYGIRLDGTDSKAFHLTTFSNSEWFYFGGYKGYQETAASIEVHVTTTGTTGSVALSWAAVPGAPGYIVYRGTSAGAESVFYIVGSSAVTDTGAGVSGTGSVTNVVTSTLATPTGITANPSSTGGALPAGDYYYRVTAIAGDGWHGSVEFAGVDNMADWVEAYGLFDAPTVYTYHHLADIVGGGGYTHFDHFWAQLGQVGIAEPLGGGFGDSYENIRIDFARLEGFFSKNPSVSVHGGQIDGSCTASNAQTINTGQESAPWAGTCVQYFAVDDNDSINDVWFSQNPGFGPSYQTADILTGGIGTTARNVHGATYQNIFFQGTLAGSLWEPETSEFVHVTGPTPSIMGLQTITPIDAAPITYLGFTNIQNGQDFYIRGGNSNVTLHYDSQILSTCSGQDINMGSVAGFLHFKGTAQGWAGQLPHVVEICPSQSTSPSYASVTLTGAITGSTQAATKAYVDSAATNWLAGGTMTGNLILRGDPTVALGAATKQYVDAHINTPTTIASSETVTFSTNPTFSISTRSSIITLTANIVSFTIGSGLDGQEKTLIFCQNGTGGFTVANPTNVHGFMTIGSTASKCNAQHYTYSAGQSAWLADSSGVINQ